MQSDKIKIRTPRPADEAALLGLIRDLNLHQRDPTEHFGPEVLARDVLAEDTFLHTLVAERVGRLVGYALFHDGYESAYAQRGVYLCDLYVVPEARRAGVGRALVAAVSAKAKKMGRTFVWWAVKDWNDGAKAFYAALGADGEPITAYALTFEHFDALAEEGEAK